MLSVTTDTETMEDTSTASKYNDIPSLPRVLPSSRRGHAHLYTALRGLIIALLRLHTCREQACTNRVPQEPAISIDLMARQYPDLYRRITSWSI